MWKVDSPIISKVSTSSHQGRVMLMWKAMAFAMTLGFQCNLQKWWERSHAAKIKVTKEQNLSHYNWPSMRLFTMIGYNVLSKFRSLNLWIVKNTRLNTTHIHRVKREKDWKSSNAINLKDGRSLPVYILAKSPEMQTENSSKHISEMSEWWIRNKKPSCQAPGTLFTVYVSHTWIWLFWL